MRYENNNGGFGDAPIDMQKAARAAKAFSWVFSIKYFFVIIVAAVFLIAGCYIIADNNRDKRECTELTRGTVVEFTEWVHHDDDGERVTYAPVFSYSYNGKEYRYKGTDYSTGSGLYEGQELDVYVDPSDPAHIYVPEYRTVKKTGISFVVMGSLLIALMIVLIIVERRKISRGIAMYEY